LFSALLLFMISIISDCFPPTHDILFICLKIAPQKTRTHTHAHTHTHTHTKKLSSRARHTRKA